jgi:Cu/Zn superoxide dismutase
MRERIAALLLFLIPLSIYADGDAGFRVPLKGADGSNRGNVAFHEGDDMTDVMFNLVGFEPGTYSVHVHEGATCDAVGGDLNPRHKGHGFKNKTGHHAGDFNVSFVVGKTGKLRRQVTVNYLGIIRFGPSVMGHTIVVHRGQDDQLSAPDGHLGPPVACAAIPVLKRFPGV